MLVMVTVIEFRLVTVTICYELVLPTATVPKFREVGETTTDCPVPERATVCGLPGALSLNDNVPLRAPFLVGVNVTLTAQFAPAATVAPQVLLEIWKSPLAVMLEMFSVALPTLVSVTVCGGLVCPIPTFLKFRADADRETAGPPPPPQPVNLKLAMRVFQLKLPVVLLYSWVYQKVKSSAGSIVIAL